MNPHIVSGIGEGVRLLREENARLHAKLAVAENKAAILDRFLESLHAMLASSDTESTPEVAALLDKVKELQEVRQQLTTATALLGECEGKVIAAATCSLDATRRHAAKDLLTRIREATKGKT